MRNIRALMPYVWPYKFYLFLSLAMMLLQVVVEFLIPFIMIGIIDEALPALALDIVLIRGLGMLGLALLGALAGFVNTYSSQKVAQSASAELRADLFTKIQTLSFKQIDHYKKSRLITNATNDIQRVQMFFTLLLRIIIRAPLMIIVGLVLAISTSLQLSQIFYITMPLLIISVVVLLIKAYPRFKKVQAALDALNGVVIENANAPQVVKSFVSQPYETQKFEDTNENYKAVNTAAESILAFAEPLIIFIFNLGIALILVFAALYLNAANPAFFNNGIPRIGLIMAFAQYSQQILIGLMMFAMILIFVSRADVSAQRINEVFSAKDDVYVSPSPVLDEIQGNLTFNQVSFKYGEGSASAIHDISFSLKAGESLAIIGSTGSGKTTLTSLIPRLYDATEGEVLIDGVSVKEYDIKKLRDQIGYVTQRAHIFSGSIGLNIAQGSHLNNYEDILKAAQDAALGEILDQKEGGLNSLTTAKGTNLSGGQKQRISMARALVKKPKILILDDSTSAVDVSTERKIIKSIAAISPKPTLLLITQKIATAKRMDKILVLDNNGYLAGFGSHDDLLKTSSVYQEIAASQLATGGESLVTA
jgi:ATP-binding cassette subfamily B protein